MKRSRDDPIIIDPYPFNQLRDKQLFEHDRNVLARIIYKNGHQYRRHEFLFQMKSAVKKCDQILQGQLQPDRVESVILAIQKASEWWYQLLCIGHMIPQSLTVVACLGRLSALLRKISISTAAPNPYSYDDDDEGVPVDS